MKTNEEFKRVEAKLAEQVKISKKWCLRANGLSLELEAIRDAIRGFRAYVVGQNNVECVDCSAMLRLLGEIGGNKNG